MSKGLFVAVTAAVMALGALYARADDKTQPQPVDEAKLKAEHDAARAEKANMTPEQKAAAKKARHAKKQKDLAHIEKTQTLNAPAKSEALSKNVEATKNDPKALPDKKSHQEALKAQEKHSSGQ
ncbi:MAG TPA: hypothetical protein VL742_15865 [Casimicrobiaceae bacterium]|nr:hypothetical protein [Casimicrobiaceae bacterium]